MAVIAQPVIDWSGATNPDNRTANISSQNPTGVIVHGPQLVVPAPLSSQLAPDPAIGFPTSG